METLQKIAPSQKPLFETSGIETSGYLEPERLLSPREAHTLLANLKNRVPSQVRPTQAQLQWGKNNAISSRDFFDIATDKRIIDKLVGLLGNDVMLWGAELAIKKAGKAHPWHSDIESWNDGRFVNVWIALQNVGSGSNLRAISGSQRFGLTVQQLRYEHGIDRVDLNDKQILEWARQRDKDSELIEFEMTDGDVLFYDGRLWHASHNFSNSTRVALLLQYATPESIIKIPDYSQLDWPFRFHDERPSCLIVHGKDTGNANMIVQAPSPNRRRNRSGAGKLWSQGVSLRLPLSSKLSDSDLYNSDSNNKSALGWTPHPILKGATKNLDSWATHASVLQHGCTPHPPHRHMEEELLIVLDGEVEVTLPDLAESAQQQTLTTGDFVYYPCNFAHTVTSKSQPAATYLMFKWIDRNAEDQCSPTLSFGRFSYRENAEVETVETGLKGFSYDKHFEGPTLFLQKLHCHFSTLLPGGGYQPHVDPYDVALVILEGQVETLGKTYLPHSVIFYAAGEPHGIRNSGNVEAKYLVFEFHGRRNAKSSSPERSLSSKLLDLQCWKRLIKSVLAGKPI